MKKILLIIGVILMMCGCSSNTSTTNYIPEGKYSVYKVNYSDGTSNTWEDLVENMTEYLDYKYIQVWDKNEAMYSNTPSSKYNLKIDDKYLELDDKSGKIEYSYSNGTLVLKVENGTSVEYRQNYGSTDKVFEEMIGTYELTDWEAHNATDLTYEKVKDRIQVQVKTDRRILLTTDERQTAFQMGYKNIYWENNPSSEHNQTFPYTYENGVLTIEVYNMWDTNIKETWTLKKK